MSISRRTFIKKAALGAIAASSMPQLLSAQNSSDSFIDKLLPAPIGGGFQMEDYWIWGSSVIKGEDGKYHMFADRWAKSIGSVSYTHLEYKISKVIVIPYRTINMEFCF